ncbi:hypothetical protein KCTC32516_02295 [Polaribacter huanghezhanensis]|uniref:hypothetical protein n=1 Tax=Polaribacter huanghezhanensis TaxID=1354726 RepID=UPI002647C0B0|nr:hypothetical protein [Polaribacter huanghezhanensis]WKD86915.1 hypothetical protein KCTC32516_02295 [Polaribacter huanghezhanensis]
MASVKNLKKDINYTLGDIIEECYIAQMLTPANSKKTEAIIDEAIESFDILIEKVHAKGVENKRAHYKAINTELEAKANALVEKLNKI